jgi:galactose mutarotase-like enzyme
MPKILHTTASLETHQLEDEASGARAFIAPARGGMVTRFQVHGVPVLYLDSKTLDDPSQSVRGGIPILFPISGKLPNNQYELGGHTYTMKQHGFARNLPWRVLEESTDDGASVTLGLEPAELTRAQYPFEFALRFTYRLRNGVLRVEQSFENRSKEPMPIQPGLHPYFYVPEADKAGARVATRATRAFDNTLGREVDVQKPIAFAGREVDLHLLDHGSQEAILERPGLPSIRIGFGAEQDVLVLWTLPGRDFICVEPWRARGGVLAQGTAPLLPAGESFSTTLELSLV